MNVCLKYDLQFAVWAAAQIEFFWFINLTITTRVMAVLPPFETLIILTKFLNQILLHARHSLRGSVGNSNCSQPGCIPYRTRAEPMAVNDITVSSHKSAAVPLSAAFPPTSREKRRCEFAFRIKHRRDKRVHTLTGVEVDQVLASCHF